MISSKRVGEDLDGPSKRVCFNLEQTQLRSSGTQLLVQAFQQAGEVTGLVQRILSEPNASYDSIVQEAIEFGTIKELRSAVLATSDQTKAFEMAHCAIKTLQVSSHLASSLEKEIMNWVLIFRHKPCHDSFLSYLIQNGTLFLLLCSTTMHFDRDDCIRLFKDLHQLPGGVPFLYVFLDHCSKVPNQNLSQFWNPLARNWSVLTFLNLNLDQVKSLAKTANDDGFVNCLLTSSYPLPVNQIGCQEGSRLVDALDSVYPISTKVFWTTILYPERKDFFRIFSAFSMVELITIIHHLIDTRNLNPYVGSVFEAIAKKEFSTNIHATIEPLVEYLIRTQTSSVLNSWIKGALLKPDRRVPARFLIHLLLACQGEFGGKMKEIILQVEVPGQGKGELLQRFMETYKNHLEGRVSLDFFFSPDKRKKRRMLDPATKKHHTDVKVSE
jgi:hypothetical protein